MPCTHTHTHTLPFLCGLSRTPPPPVVTGGTTKICLYFKRKILVVPPVTTGYDLNYTEMVASILGKGDQNDHWKKNQFFLMLLHANIHPPRGHPKTTVTALAHKKNKTSIQNKKQ